MGFGKPAPGKSYPAAYLWGRVRGADGIFRSDDAGKTWRRINDDRHQFGGINDITGDPRLGGRVYLATSGRGVMQASRRNSAGEMPRVAGHFEWSNTTFRAAMRIEAGVIPSPDRGDAKPLLGDVDRRSVVWCHSV